MCPRASKITTRVTASLSIGGTTVIDCLQCAVCTRCRRFLAAAGRHHRRDFGSAALSGRDGDCRDEFAPAAAGLGGGPS